MATNAAYQKLTEILDAPGSGRLLKILEVLMTPEEAGIAIEMPSFTTPEKLAQKLKVDEQSLRAKLQDMSKRGVIAAGKDGFACHSNLMMLCHRSQKYQDLPEDKLWTDFFLAEWRYIIAEQAHQRRLTGRWSVHRILPALQALAASPHISRDQVLWYENLEVMLKRARQIKFIPCTCRAQYGRYVGCKNKVDLCLHVVLDDDISQPIGDFSRFKNHSYQEALDELYAAEDNGMVHLCLNYPYLQEMCNCCEDCCRVINPLIHAGKDYDLMDPSKSRYQASIDQDLCSGCQTCVERCHFNAIEMQKIPGSQKMKAHMIEKYCVGCGLCVYKCPQQAIKFNIVRPPSFIPSISMASVFSGEPFPLPETG